MPRLIFTPKRASGKRESWAKTVTDVDPKGRGSKAFKGDYLESGIQTDLEIGTLIIEVVPCGSVKNGYHEAGLLRVTEDGFEKIDSGWDWRTHFLNFRDFVIEQLAENRSPKDSEKPESYEAATNRLYEQWCAGETERRSVVRELLSMHPVRCAIVTALLYERIEYADHGKPELFALLEDSRD